MISKEQMFGPILSITPSFSKTWNEFVSEWHDYPDGLPYYLALSELASHLIALFEAENNKEIQDIFVVVEEWLTTGDQYVKEAATFGLFEDLQNSNLHRNTCPKDFVQFLKPEALYWWNKVERFWEHGELIGDDRTKVL